jgi:hypothetical protein
VQKHQAQKHNDDRANYAQKLSVTHRYFAANNEISEPNRSRVEVSAAHQRQILLDRIRISGGMSHNPTNCFPLRQIVI